MKNIGPNAQNSVAAVETFLILSYGFSFLAFSFTLLCVVIGVHFDVLGAQVAAVTKIALFART